MRCNIVAGGQCSWSAMSWVSDCLWRSMQLRQLPLCVWMSNFHRKCFGKAGTSDTYVVCKPDSPVSLAVSTRLGESAPASNHCQYLVEVWHTCAQLTSSTTAEREGIPWRTGNSKHRKGERSGSSSSWQVHHRCSTLSVRVAITSESGTSMAVSEFRFLPENLVWLFVVGPGRRVVDGTRGYSVGTSNLRSQKRQETVFEPKPSLLRKMRFLSLALICISSCYAFAPHNYHISALQPKSVLAQSTCLSKPCLGNTLRIARDSTHTNRITMSESRTGLTKLFPGKAIKSFL
jgi:hypothetical protein